MYSDLSYIAILPFITFTKYFYYISDKDCDIYAKVKIISTFTYNVET